MRTAIFTYTMDRVAMGTALYTSKLVENLLKIKKPEDELYLVHRQKFDHPLYRHPDVREIIMPKICLPRFSNLISEALFLWRTRNAFDVIHYPQESNYPLFWLSKAKIIITMHSAVEGWREFGALRSRWWLIYWTLRLFQNKISAIITVSESTKKSIQKFFKISNAKIKVVYEGVDKIFLQKQDKLLAQKLMNQKYGLPAPYILNGSRIDPHKNVQRLVRAFCKVKEKLKIPHKLVVGPKHWLEENEKVEKLIGDLGLKDNIIFMPYIEPEDMPMLYAAADLFVFPSLHEGFGLPILEAMAVGTPVITSNVFAMPEVAGDAALLVNPYNTEEIFLAMCRLLKDQSLRRELVNKGAKQINKFSWLKMAKETAEIYQKLSL